MEYFKSFISCKNINVFVFYEQKFDLEENRKWLKDDIIYIYKKNFALMDTGILRDENLSPST